MPAPLYQGPCASFVCCMGISGLGILFDLLWYVLVFGAAAVMAKWMIELHWTRAHTEYVTELLDCGRLSISERCTSPARCRSGSGDGLCGEQPGILACRMPATRIRRLHLLFWPAAEGPAVAAALSTRARRPPRRTRACCADQVTPQQPRNSSGGRGKPGWLTSGAFALPSGLLLSH